MNRYNPLQTPEPETWQGLDESVMSTLLTLGALGNGRTQTLRVFSVYDIGQIVDKML